MSETDERGATAQLYRKIVEPSLRHMKLDCHPHHHNVHLHTAFHAETGHCRLGPAAGDNGRPLTHPSDRQTRHGILPKIARSNAVNQQQPENPCSVGSGSYRQTPSNPQSFHSVSQTKELPLLTVRSNERGITLLPRHAAHRSISRSSQYRYLGTTKAVKDQSGDENVHKSEQVRRFQEEQRALDQTRHLKRISEMYYMCGSKVSLRGRYHVDVDDFERSRASYEEQSRSRVSRSAHSRTEYRNDGHIPSSQVKGELTIDLLTGTVTASSSNQRDSEVVGVLGVDKTTTEDFDGTSHEVELDNGSPHLHENEQDPGEVRGHQRSDAATDSEENSSDSLLGETNSPENLPNSHHEMSVIEGHSDAHHGNDTAGVSDASRVTTFVTQGNEEDGLGYEEGKVNDHLNSHHGDDITHGSHSSGETAVVTQGNESDCNKNDNIACPTSEIIASSNGLNKSHQVLNESSDARLSSDQKGLDEGNTTAGDVMSEGVSTITEFGHRDVSRNVHDGMSTNRMDDDCSLVTAADDLGDTRVCSEEEEDSPQNEQDETDPVTVQEPGASQDQTEKPLTESPSSGEENGKHRGQEEIGFGIVLDNTPYMATKQEIYSNTSFENPALRHYEDLATMSSAAGQSGIGGQYLLDQSQQSSRDHELSKNLDTVGHLRESKVDVDLLREGDVDGSTNWDVGVYGKVLNDEERKEREDLVAKRRSEKIDARGRQEAGPANDGGGDGKVLDIRARLNLTDVYSFITARQRMIFQRKFQELDVDGNGKVTLKELTKRMKKDSTKDNFKELVKVFDLNDDKTINLREFVTVAALNDKLQGQEIESEMAPLRLNLKKLGLHITAYKEIFELVDKDDSGHLSMDEVIFIISVSVGAEIGTNEEIVDYIFKTVDVNEDGRVDFVEFLSFIPFFLKLHSEMIGRPTSFDDVIAANKAVKAALCKKPAKGYSIG